MEYILPVTLIIISYFLGVYFSNQGLRDKISRPLVYINETILLTLTILFGWVLTLVALYLAYRDSGLLFTLTLFLVRFVFMPTLLNNRVKGFMEKNGI